MEPSRRSRLVAPLLLAGLAVPGTAGADGAWGPPQPLRYGGPASLPGTPAVVLNRAGLGVAVADTGGGRSAGPRSAASVFTNGVFLDPFTFTTTNTAVGPRSGALGVYGRTGLLVTGVHRTTRSAQAVAGFGRLGPNRASPGRLRPIGPAGLHAYAPATAVDAAGDAAIVFAVCRDAGCRRALVYLTARRAGSSRLTSTRLTDTRGPLPKVGVAINDRGDALAVWTQGTGVFARVRTAGGRLRSRRRVGSTQRGSQAAPSAALSRHRAELVGWSTQVVHEGDPSPGEVRVAQARDGRAFAQARLAGLPAVDGQPVAGPGVQVAFDRAGLRHLAWTAYAGTATTGRFTVSSALLRGAASRAIAMPVDTQVVSDPTVDTVLEDLDVDPGGGELVAMRAGVRGSAVPSGSAVVQVASRGGIGSPFTRDALSAAGEYAISAQSALAPGRAVVVWGTATQGARYAERAGTP